MLAHLLPTLSKSPTYVIPEPPVAVLPNEDAAIAIHKLDFPALGLPQYRNKFALVIDNLFNKDDCDKLLKAAEASAPWEVAQVHGGPNFQFTNTNYRNSSRIMLDDRELAAWILEKLRPYLADIETEDGEIHQRYSNPTEKSYPPVRLSRLNERLRFLKYGAGQFFKPHCDGTYNTSDCKEVSYYTLQIYLSGDAKSLKGGATRFWVRDRTKKESIFVDVESRLGRVLIFEQAGLLHSGEMVSKGEKISMRTDFLYMRDSDVTPI